MSKISKMDKSKELYERKYSSGYGINFPESHVIRILNYLDGEFLIKQKKLNILDFGCGNGTHCVYFNEIGWDCFGVDVSEAAIEMCKERLDSSNFAVINPGGSIKNLFNAKFDIIFANQSLYYLTDSALNRVLEEMNYLLNPSGLVIFTMMGSQNYYYNNIDLTEPKQDGISKVVLKGRLEEESYINFINSEEELVNKFNIFEKILTGYYDFSMEEGSSFHYYYLGKKKK